MSLCLEKKNQLHSMRQRSITHEGKGNGFMLEVKKNQFVKIPPSTYNHVEQNQKLFHKPRLFWRVV